MIVKIYGKFGDFERFWSAKNKANRRDLAGNPKLEALHKESLGRNPKRVERVRLKKQSQFIVVQRSAFRVLRKESQGQRLKQKGAI